METLAYILLALSVPVVIGAVAWAAILHRCNQARTVMHKHTLQYSVHEEDGAFVARCLDVEVASEGDTREEAVANLFEALALYAGKQAAFSGRRTELRQ